MFRTICTNSVPLGKILAALAALFALVGCGTADPLTEDEIATRHQFKPPYNVEHTTHRHLIALDPARTDFEEQPRRDLYGFLVGVGARPGDRVIVAARRARLDHRSEVVSFVRELGLKPDLRLIKELQPGAEDDGYDKAILIQFDRYAVRQPECGKWDYRYETRFYNTSPDDFGCSTTAQLQQQVAYPSSLISGETLDFPEGDVAAESVSRYRGRQVEAIKVEASGGG